jgi:uncharacterized protein YqeY
MSLQDAIMTALKAAMKSKDTLALTALRSVKSAILLAQTESGSKGNMSEADEVKLLQKLVKQRRDSAEIFTQQNRPDLAAPEIKEAKIISQFLPEMLSEVEVEDYVKKAIGDLGATSMKDMGKVMGFLSQELSGKTDGKTISTLVKKHLMS